MVQAAGIKQPSQNRHRSQTNNDQPILTSAAAARLVQVHESSIKRWCNENQLRAFYTHGGHRRIALADLIAFAQKMKLNMPLKRFAPDEVALWQAIEHAERSQAFQPLIDLNLNWIYQQKWSHLEALFPFLGQDLHIAFDVVFDECIAQLMQKLGQAWVDGDISVATEHFSTQVILDSLHCARYVLRNKQSVKPKNLVAIVGCAEGDQHELGAMGTRILLEMLGWQVFYLGSNVPVDELARFQKEIAADLLCVSFIPPRSHSDVLRTMRILSQNYNPADPYSLAVGGGAISTQTLQFDHSQFKFQRIGVFNSLQTFRFWLETNFTKEAI